MERSMGLIGLRSELRRKEKTSGAHEWPWKSWKDQLGRQFLHNHITITDGQVCRMQCSQEWKLGKVLVIIASTLSRSLKG